MESSLSILRSVFGYESFRPLQQDIIDSVLSGRDTLALLPTGGGKSLCFQVPTLVLASQWEEKGEIGGLCLVVTPLIALMRDQVANLRERGIMAAAIYTGMSYDRQRVAINNCRFGPYRFLYVSPERLESEEFLRELRTLPIRLIAVDEAHCISQWGYDFRPSYLRIGNLRLREDGSALRVPILALTATATPEVVDDIQARLGFEEHNVFRSSFRRANLRYVVRYVGESQPREKDGELIHILSSVQGAAIVYCRNRKRCKDLSEFIARTFGLDSVDYYHAGLTSAEREAKQEAWKSGERRIIVCTNAFGMGIDKPDVRLVIHYNIPSSIESYFQEAGRAGRDGKTAYCVLLYDHVLDKQLAARRVGDSYPEPEFIERVYNTFCNYFEIGAGSGAGHGWSFQLDDVAMRMRLPVVQTVSALTILAQAGYIQFEEDQETRPRVRINMTSREFARVSLTDDEEKTLEALMREYPGVYTDLQWLREDHHRLYASLAAKGVITYIPRTIASRFVLVQDRQVTLRLPDAIYANRRSAYADRLAKMVAYAEQNEIPSEDYLIRYFGEND